MVLRQDRVRVQPGTVPVVGVKLPVRCGAGVEHQPCGLIAGIVELVNAQVVGNPPPYGLVFFSGHGAFQWSDKAKPGLLRGMLVGGVDRRRTAIGQVEHIQQIQLSQISVQREQCPLFHTARLAPAAFQPAPNEASHVLDRVLFFLAHLEILPNGFFRPGSCEKLVQELRPQQLLVFADFRQPGGIGGNMNLAVMSEIFHNAPP